MSTTGFIGYYIETRNYGATAALWRSLGFEAAFETGHGSGQFEHPAGGPYVFVAEQHDRPLDTHPILGVADVRAFSPSRTPDYAMPFTPQHWGVMEAHLRDSDGRTISLQGPLPPGVSAPDEAAHHEEKYGPAGA